MEPARAGRGSGERQRVCSPSVDDGHAGGPRTSGRSAARAAGGRDRARVRTSRSSCTSSSRIVSVCGSCASSTMRTAKTIEARPRGPNQPTNADRLSAGAAAQQRDGDREHPHEREAEHRVEDDAPGQLAERWSEQDGAEGDERHAVEQPTELLVERGDARPGRRRRRPPKHMPADERGDEARAAERGRDPVGERRAGDRDDLQPRVADQPATPGEHDHSGRHRAGGHAARRSRSRSPRLPR